MPRPAKKALVALTVGADDQLFFHRIIAEEGIEEGDALLFNYGWSKLWTDAETYNTNPPGIGGYS